ncbi:hypothetical protein BDQ17DRAFT_513668 [Cyathus striatus]|nr:hypothetical protein BDQ17DRAFT_513668 [Cyathus striatus]
MSLSKAPFDEDYRFVTSYALSPAILGAVRISLGLFTLASILSVLIYGGIKDHSAGAYFSYFTHLSLIGLCSYFWATGVQTIAFARSSDGTYPLQRWPRALRYLQVLLTTTITTFPIVVTVVYWGLIAGSDSFASPYTSWANVSQHLLNTVFALFEIGLTNIPPLPWVDLPLTLVMLGGYLGVAYITHLTQGFYAYSFLDPKEQGKLLIAYFVGIAVGQAIVFVAVRYAIVLRSRIVRKKSKDLRNPGMHQHAMQKQFA